MPTGQPDYGAYASKKVLASLSDMGELAVRFGAIPSVDRKGSIILQDDFESPVFKWNTFSNLGSLAILSSESVKSGSQAVKLTTTAGATDFIRISRTFYAIGQEPQGIELSFSDQSQDSKLFVKVTYHDGTNRHRAWFYIDFSTKKGYVQVTDGGSYEEFSDSLGFIQSIMTYHPLKIVLDFSNDKYVRAIIGSIEYDLSSYAIPEAASIQSPSILIDLESVNVSGSGTTLIYLDDVIYTTDEVA